MEIYNSVIFGLFVLVLTNIEAARILVYIATPSISHQVVFRPLTQALAARGHEVIFVTTDPIYTNGDAPANLTEVDVHEVSYRNLNDTSMKDRGKRENFSGQVLLLFDRFAKIFDAQLSTPGVKEILKKDKKYFDVLLLESCNRPLIGLAYKFDAPVILVSSFGVVLPLYDYFGAPVHPLVYPATGMQRVYNLSIFEKIVELYKMGSLGYLISSTEANDMQILRKHFGDDVPNFKTISKRIDMLFANEHPIWADNHPVPPSIVFIGGIHQAKTKELPTDLKQFLDFSKHGVIYVSFGTNVVPSLLPPEKIQIMAEVFSKLPYDILWKYDKDVLSGKSSNIKISKWFPQTDLLGHPNIKLFITQGGLQSTDEAINAAVPVIGIPMLGDQWYNVEKYVHHKVGLQLDIQTLSAEELKASIERVINDKSFKKNMVKLRTLMREYPIKPVDLAVWWTEYVIKYGGRHLHSPAARISWAEYFELKLIATVMIVSVITLILISLILKSIVMIILKLLRKLKGKTKIN